MATQTWLPLTDYSTKYRVSISTLRRRIKTEKINFQLAEGKYFILDAPIERRELAETQLAFASVPPKPGVANQDVYASTPVSGPTPVSNQPIFDTANRMLDELKKAYMLILQEKEEQTLQLKEEIADLRTLARVFEAENNRLVAALEKKKQE